MYVCVCNAISEEQLQNSMNIGLRGSELLKHLGVGNNCGTCLIEASKKFDLLNEISKSNTSSQLLNKDKI